MSDPYSFANQRHSLYQLCVVFCRHFSFKVDIIYRSYSISVPILRAFCGSMGHTKYTVSFMSWQKSTEASLAIMQLRIYAMYRKSKKILAFTGVCFILEIAAICTVLALNFDHSLTYTNEPIPGLLNMCATSTINRSFTAIYVPIFCFELLLFVLAIFVVFEHMKNTRTISGKRVHNTMATLVKYNTIYFFV